MAGRLAKATVILGLGLALSGCANLTACSAVGYLYAGPAVLEFSEALLDTASVAACFGEECAPAALERADGQGWEVPQEAPYLDHTSTVGGSERTVRVVVTDAGGAVLSDAAHEVPVTAEKTGVFGQCPGPFRFEPVGIALGS